MSVDRVPDVSDELGDSAILDLLEERLEAFAAELKRALAPLGYAGEVRSSVRAVGSPTLPTYLASTDVRVLREADRR